MKGLNKWNTINGLPNKYMGNYKDGLRFGDTRKARNKLFERSDLYGALGYSSKGKLDPKRFKEMQHRATIENAHLFKTKEALAEKELCKKMKEVNRLRVVTRKWAWSNLDKEVKLCPLCDRKLRHEGKYWICDLHTIGPVFKITTWQIKAKIKKYYDVVKNKKK